MGRLAALLRGEWALDRRILDNRKTSEALARACAGSTLPDVARCGDALLGHVTDGVAKFSVISPSALETTFTDAQREKIQQQLNEQGQGLPFLGGVGEATDSRVNSGGDVLLYSESGAFHLKGTGQMAMRREYLYIIDSTEKNDKVSESNEAGGSSDVSVFFHIPNNEAEHLKFFHRLRFDGLGSSATEAATSHSEDTNNAAAQGNVAHAEHLCSQDLYKVRFSIGTAGAPVSPASSSAAAAFSFETFSTAWNVTGPSKDYTIYSVYTKRQHETLLL